MITMQPKEREAAMKQIVDMVHDHGFWKEWQSQIDLIWSGGQQGDQIRTFCQDKGLLVTPPHSTEKRWTFTRPTAPA